MRRETRVQLVLPDVHGEKLQFAQRSSVNTTWGSWKPVLYTLHPALLLRRIPGLTGQLLPRSATMPSGNATGLPQSHLLTWVLNKMGRRTSKL